MKMVVLARVMAVSATPRPHPRPLNPHSRSVSSSSRWCMGAAQLSKGIHALGLSPCINAAFGHSSPVRARALTDSILCCRVWPQAMRVLLRLALLWGLGVVLAAALLVVLVDTGVRALASSPTSPTA
eukprot:COSAG02_NODE_430_length_22462_cov_52.755042_14_plen_127_part_00